MIDFLLLAGAITKRAKKTAETSKKKTKTLVATSRGSIETSKAWRDLDVGLPGSAMLQYRVDVSVMTVGRADAGEAAAGVD